MPSGIHEVEVNIPIERVWEFVIDMNQWAPLVPGYTEHQIINEKQTTWAFIAEVGVVHKKISLQIDITDQQEPIKVTFDLKGLTQNFHGNGYFEAKALSETKTKMTGYLNIQAVGILGPMANNILKSYLPKTTTEFTNSIADKLMNLETVPK